MTSKTQLNVLCPLPFVHSFFDVKGVYSACCNGSFLANSKHISKISAEEWFYSKEMQQLRADMLNDVRNPMCLHCWKKDDLGISSPRKQHINFWKDKTIDYDNPKIKYFDLKPSNHCNLACLFCTASSSDKITKITKNLSVELQPTRWAGSLVVVDKLKEIGTFDPTVVEYIKENIEDLELLKFTGGEPFLSKEVLEILTMVSNIKPEVELKITTNGTVITKDFYPILKKMKKTSIKFSIDAVDDAYDYLRFPSKWSQFQARIENNMKNLPNVSFNVNTLITNINLEQLPKIRNWFKELQIKYCNLSFIIIDPNLSPDNNEAGIMSMDPKYLIQIKKFLEKETADWDFEDKTDSQMLAVYKKIDEAISKNLYKKNKDILKQEFYKHNFIRKLKVQDVVEPITKEFFEGLLK